jgi:hypothetical protein
MAKHAHKLILLNHKTWKCLLPGCNFFVHLGLAHVLIGKQSICWNCEEPFQLAEWSLKEDKPRCDECRGISSDAIAQLLKDKGIE